MCWGREEGEGGREEGEGGRGEGGWPPVAREVCFQALLIHSYFLPHHRLERVVALEPHNIEALSNLALVTNDLHNDDKHKDTLYRLAYSYHRSKKTSDTIETLQRLTDIDPEYLDSASLLHYFKNVGKK